MADDKKDTEPKAHIRITSREGTTKIWIGETEVSNRVETVVFTHDSNRGKFCALVFHVLPDDTIDIEAIAKLELERSRA